MTEENQQAPGRPVWIIILRIVLIILLLAAALIAGTVVGYVVLGKQDVSDIWHLDTWRHVFDLVFAP